MPLIRTTIASNVNRSKRAPLLISIPDPWDKNPFHYGRCLEIVHQEARKKLHLKHALRVYTTDGKNIHGEQAWEDVLKNEVVLIVAGNEDYVGARTYKEPAESQGDSLTTDVKEDCPTEILADQAEISPTSIAQLETTARTLPGIVHATGQPDLHPGTKFPIGAVFVSKDWIHPPLIGGDIGCGMAWYKTALSRHQVEEGKGRKIAEKLRGLEGPWRTQEYRKLWLEQERQFDDKCFNSDSTYIVGEEWDKSIGTIGAGNHFAELQIVEESVMSGEDKNCLREADVVLLIHSGSRGYGAEVLKRLTSDGRISIPTNNKKCDEYLMDHTRACEWASRNRDLIALRFLSILKPDMPIWDRAMYDTDTHMGAINIRQAQSAVRARKIVDVYHNNLEKTDWPPNVEEVARTKHYIHRKGAAPTISPNYNEKVPTDLFHILPLPGSRATPTLILHPTSTEANDFGRINALSVAHGPGRALSRAKAATCVAEKYAG